MEINHFLNSKIWFYFKWVIDDRENKKLILFFINIWDIVIICLFFIEFFDIILNKFNFKEFLNNLIWKPL
jgi:hypothetical protein